MLNFAGETEINIQNMKAKNERLRIIKMLISSREIGNQDDLLKELAKENIHVTQATLSRDLKQLKVAKAASMNGKYVYVLPNETMYKRVADPVAVRDMMQTSGMQSISFSGNMCVIKTRPGYASAIAYNIDESFFDEILGTIAGDDTILIVLKEGTDRSELAKKLALLQ